MVVKSRTPGQLAGTLCPNPVLHDGMRFDQVVGNRFALVTSSPLSVAQQQELSSRGAVVVSVASGSELGRWLKQGRATAAIVRPDGAVMQAGRNIEALCDTVPSFSVGDTARADSERTHR
jgi:3-(3-hydroxy-phenyl)propionate hydroxylase